MRLVSALALLVALLSGCDGLAPASENATPAEVRAARDAWLALDVSDYRFRYEMVCECFGGADVTVRNRRIVRAEGPGAGVPWTMERVFASAMEAAEGAYGSTVRLSAETPRIPVVVNMNPDLQPLDGGFILTVRLFRLDRTATD